VSTPAYNTAVVGYGSWVAPLCPAADKHLMVAQVLHPKYASVPKGRRFYSFGFALLHANALLYAADCTVAVLQHTVRMSKDKKTSRWVRAQVWLFVCAIIISLHRS